MFNNQLPALSRMEDQQLKQLERKIDELITLSQMLSHENAQFRAKESAWLQERKGLIEKTEIARTRVENMITRLKALEQES